MRVNKAKRKLLKWERYDARCRKLCSIFGHSWFYGSYYNGHAKAYYNYSVANRYVPIGIRSPYRAKWMVS